MDKKKNTIVVAGLVCLDITPQFPTNAVYDFQSCMLPGKLLRTHGVTVSAGGAVANTGIGLKKLGANVHLMYMVGADEFGALVSRQLDSHQIPCTRLVTEKGATGYSVVVALPGHDRILLHDVGANDILSATDFDEDVIRNACIFHFGYPPSMRQFYLNQGKELIRMFQRIRNMDVATSLDMALANPESESGQQDWRQIIRDVIPYVDLFEPSLEELMFFLEPEHYDEWNQKARENSCSIPEIVPREHVEALADQLIQWGGRVVLVKCGSKGMHLRTASQEALNQIGGTLSANLSGWGDQKIHIPCYQVDHIRSGTGAGDTSIAGFLYALQRGFPLQRCVELAAATGAVCVTTYDALSAIVPLDELNCRIETGWKRADAQ